MHHQSFLSRKAVSAAVLPRSGAALGVTRPICADPLSPPNHPTYFARRQSLYSNAEPHVLDARHGLAAMHADGSPQSATASLAFRHSSFRSRQQPSPGPAPLRASHLLSRSHATRRKCPNDARHPHAAHGESASAPISHSHSRSVRNLRAQCTQRRWITNGGSRR